MDLTGWTSVVLCSLKYELDENVENGTFYSQYLYAAIIVKSKPKVFSEKHENPLHTYHLKHYSSVLNRASGPNSTHSSSW